MKTLINFLSRMVQVLEVARVALQTFDDNDVGIDDEAAKLLQTIIDNIRLFIKNNQPNETAPTVAKGYTAILNYCNEILTSINLIIEGNLPKDAKITKIEGLIENLYNPNKVYQAQKGKDAEVLSYTKEKATEKLEKVKAE